MRYINKNNNQGYTVIVAILLTGFLLVLVAGVANFVIRELYDSKAREQYLQAFAMAEGSMELGLMKIKQEGFYYSEKKDYKVLNETPKLENYGSESNFMSYEIEDGTSEITEGHIDPLEQVIIPLFHNREGTLSSVKNKIDLNVSGGGDTNLAWNFIASDASGISGGGSFDENETGFIKKADQSVDSGKKIKDLLTKNGDKINIGGIEIDNFVYLSLFNTGYNTTDTINYRLKSNSGEKFTKPIIKITASAKIGNYKQNIETEVDNSDLLGALKFSIFSE